ncbi:MAG: orotidine-5'-phosphate decarboxylase [Bacteroidetes bacterium]|nr:orotidine-5'-phosphate decarboxylase [Bacteroidota bacterium]MCW5895785.1 orotidine-5'-phosphate decarboxylase [Bacteroidota bacterium]
MTFFSKLRQSQQQSNSLLCIGLDSDLKKIPRHLLGATNPILEFNKRIIAATKDLVCAYKLNLAFYEALGETGWRTIKETLAAIPPDVITIGDAKRGDIGNTAEMYARSLRDDFGFAASTVNPYMGFDSVEPFITDERHGAFILALTSNPGAKDFEYMKVKEKPLYEQVIVKVKKWNVKRNCGLVIGATRPKELQRVRKLAHDLPLLIPGVGAQGGDLAAAVRYGCDKNGEMAIINSSRGIIYASGGDDFAGAARAAALTLRDQMNAIREEFF